MLQVLANVKSLLNNIVEIFERLFNQVFDQLKII